MVFPRGDGIAYPTLIRLFLPPINARIKLCDNPRLIINPISSRLSISHFFRDGASLKIESYSVDNAKVLALLPQDPLLILFNYFYRPFANASSKSFAFFFAKLRRVAGAKMLFSPTVI